MVVEDEDVADAPVDQDARLLDQVGAQLQVAVRDRAAVAVRRQVVKRAVGAEEGRLERGPLLGEQEHGRDVAKVDRDARERVPLDRLDVVHDLERPVGVPGPLARVPLDLLLDLGARRRLVVAVEDAGVRVGARDRVAEVRARVDLLQVLVDVADALHGKEVQNQLSRTKRERERANERTLVASSSIKSGALTSRRANSSAPLLIGVCPPFVASLRPKNTM